MPEIRRDSITGQQVIFAPARARRPGAFVPVRDPEHCDELFDRDCPFCPKNESATPPELLTLPSEVAPQNWTTRVVPNLYPALGADIESRPSAEPSTIAGRHEVVIESRRHVESFTALNSTEVANAFLAARERFLDWRHDETVVYPLAFKNCRPKGGASLFHVHSQLVGLPFVPPQMERELAGAEKRGVESGACPFCQLIDEELAERSRLVWEDADVVVVCPFASRVPYEMTIFPRAHHQHFELDDAARVMHVARVVQSCLRRLERVAGAVAYNFLIHTSPFHRESESFYHWHVEILPRVAQLAGFEWGTGCLINPLLPERAAMQLRGDAGTSCG